MTQAEKQERLPYTVHQTKYLKFVLVKYKPKTKVYAVVSVNHGNELGRIEWFSQWRQYCFMPFGMTVWNTNCLKDIENFVTVLMVSRKPKPKTVGVICKDRQDFIAWSHQKKHKRKSTNTVKKYVHGTTTYVCVSQPTDCCGYALNKIVETDAAVLNKNYHTLVRDAQLCLIK